MTCKAANHPSRQEGTVAAENAVTRLLRQLTPPAQTDEIEPTTPAIDYGDVERLGFYGVSPAAMAVLLGCDQTRLENEFAHAIGHGRARYQRFLLEKLAEKIENGEWPALKFALLNVCGMADNPAQAALQPHKLAQLREQQAPITGTQPVQPGLEAPIVAEIGRQAKPIPPSAAAPLAPRTAPGPRQRLQARRGL